MFRTIIKSSILFLFPVVLLAQSQAELTVQKIMQNPSWIGNQPQRPFWSENSKWIYFYWNPENVDADSLYKVSPAGGKAVKVSTAERSTLVGSRGSYSHNFKQKLYISNGDVFLYDAGSKKSIQITKTAERESNVQFTGDESGVVFQRGKNLFRWDKKTRLVEQLIDFRAGKNPDDTPKSTPAHEEFVHQEELSLMQILRERKAKRERTKAARKREQTGPPKIFIDKMQVYTPRLSPDGRFITVRFRDKAPKQKATIVPDYVNESGYTRDLKTRTKVGRASTRSKLAIVNLEEGTMSYVKPDALPTIFDVHEFTVASAKNKKASPAKKKARPVTFYNPVWNQDGTSAFVQAVSGDNKDRWLALLDVATGTLQPFEHQHDDAWIGGPNIRGRYTGPDGSIGWLPDGRTIWFCSEETGYSHLYTYNIDTRKKVALTSGEFEIYNPSISRDKKHWYFAANQVHPGERHFYRLPLAGGKMEKLTSLPGHNDARVSPDAKWLLIRHSYMNKPWEIYAQKMKVGADAKQLTFSTTEAWRAYSWRTPKIVRITANDGERPYARLYKPEKPNGAGVIFVHGAGYLQNAHKWWSSYFREYMFHNLLADAGYTVLDVDYRGSAGYGRDWRTGIYRHMGGKDLSDQVDAAKWMVKEMGVDSKRIGIYGGSYGGFITLMAMFTEAETFAAGAALRSVTDWAHYNHGYTSNILNIPQADTLAYRQSSPIYFAEGLKGHLLICHGMIDTNVHFQDVVRLAQRLIELGKKNWEFAVYPIEGHGFREPSSWTDEYRRIFELFERTLR